MTLFVFFGGGAWQMLFSVENIAFCFAHASKSPNSQAAAKAERTRGPLPKPGDAGHGWTPFWGGQLLPTKARNKIHCNM